MKAPNTDSPEKTWSVPTDRYNGRVRTIIFDPQQSMVCAWTINFDPKPDPTQKKQPDTLNREARANPTLGMYRARAMSNDLRPELAFEQV
jgi:hypothetical protein